MPLRPIRHFAVARPDPPQLPDLTKYLVVDGHLPIPLPGDVLKSQYECRHGYLLVVGVLTAYLGEDLRFVLLSKQYELLDVVLCSDAGPFGETDSELTHQAPVDDLLEFVFGGKRFRVRVLETPTKWRQEWLSLRFLREDKWAEQPRYLWFTRVRSLGLRRG